MVEVVLGIDLSTQSCKCLAIDVETLKVLAASAVVYDSDLPAYATRNGMHRNEEQPPVVTSPTIMWAEALIKCLSTVLSCGPVLSPVAISGSAQQHATVYWRIGQGDAVDTSSLNALSQQLSVQESPIWMNNTTARWCHELRAAFAGGDEGLQRATGIRATERFSVFHIAAHLSAPPSETRAVSLASSFATSLLVGRVCGTDVSDASGTGALSLLELDWCDGVFDALHIKDGRTLLGELLDPTSVVGLAAPLCQQIPPTVRVVPFTGDNPSAVVGMGLTRVGDVLISLGTSDTCIVVGRRGESVALPPNTYTFPHPLYPTEQVCHMMVYANGDLARRRVRDMHYGGSWERFSASLDVTRGDGNLFRSEASQPLIGVSLAVNEICPPIAVPVGGLDAYFKGGEALASLTDLHYHGRLCIEHRALSMVGHMQPLLPHTGGRGRLLITGGASTNTSILNVFADAFQMDVWVNDTNEAAAYGAALRALWGITGEEKRGALLERIETKCSGTKVSGPLQQADVSYTLSCLQVAFASLA